MIEAQNLSYSIEGKNILKDVSTKVEAGKFLAVLGANGAGKTTLLRSLSGEIHPPAKRLEFEGRSYSGWASDELALKRAVLSQNIDVSFHFQVMDIVLMGRYAHTHGYEGEKDYEIAELALKHADAFGFCDRQYNTLSGGEKQRVQLARVLAQLWRDQEASDSRYLFLDEPTSSLDIEHQYRMMNFIKKFADENVGVFCILHDINLAAAFADKVLILKKGRVLGQGDVNEMVTRELIEEAYGISVEVHRLKKTGKPYVVPVGEYEF